jgi:molybdopterin-containing oxidoreductase family iron-sulfur binding subunit
MEPTTHTLRLDEPEFPGYANVFESTGEAVPLDADPAAAALNRRSFLALSTATALAAAAGCRRPDLQILPYSAIPDDQIGHIAPGRPTFYATAIPRPGGALPVLVESHDGRPTKIEGNPKHPASGGSTDAFAQASILDLYSPDRVMSDRYPGVMERGVPRTWADFDRLARTLADRFAKTQGEGLYILMDQTPSPSLRLIREHVKKTLPKASWHTYEPVSNDEALKGAEIAFGRKLVAKYDFSKIDRILALDCDFLGSDPNAVEYGRAFAARRKLDNPGDTMNRLYAVESTYTVTGTMADHRLRLPAAMIGALLISIAREIQSLNYVLPKLPDSGLLPEQIRRWAKLIADDMKRNKRAVVIGPRQPAWAHALAHTINGALNASVDYRLAPSELMEKGISDLANDLRDGKVSTLLVIGGNPVFNAPADLNFRAELQKVTTKIRLGLFHDQTSEACDWHLPLAHSLESWGDTETSDGTLCCVQPLIAPLNSAKSPGGSETEPPPRGGRSPLEVLSLLTAFQNPADGKPVTNYLAAQKASYALVRKVFAERSGIAPDAKEFDTEFNRYKQIGFLPAAPLTWKGKQEPKKETEIKTAEVVKAIPAQTAPAPTKEALEVTFHPDYSVYDGRFAMNPWLQELPDPITKLVWDNAAIVSPKTASEFGLKQGDVVKLTVTGSSIEIPIYVLPGQADYSIALPFGQFGEMRISNVPDGGGTNVYPLRKSNAMHIATGCTLEKTGRKADLVVTQEHGVIPEGRDIVRDISVGREPKSSEASAHAHPSHHDHGPPIGLPPDGHITEQDLKKGFQGGYGNKQQPPAPAIDKQKRFPLDLARPELLDSQFQWGMVIDLSACTGCSACTVACQAENNIPVVGKHEVKRNREMHWIRIDRYFSSDGHAAHENPTVVNQPLACVHCEQAPCEQVCPVNAALHSPEGLNLQVYNRCIGTRYCSNACPYKVRRFNWFDFNKRGLNELRTATPFAKDGMSLEHNLLPETLRMQKNPDVTVRMRGVMEKCTYCIQRIERGKYGAKIAATEVAQGRRTIEIDDAYKPARDSITGYRKPKNPLAAGYDLDPEGRVIVPDGIIVTACQAACPTQAITFGNVLDRNSAVFKAKLREGEYLLLGELNTKPRTSYLPRVRNPNPELTGG